MYLYENALWQSDLDVSIKALPELSKLNGSSIIITGASGLICSAVVDILCRYNDIYDSNINIFLAGRNREKMGRRFQLHRPDLHFIYYHANQELYDLEGKHDYIIHGASNSSPNHIITEPVETMLSNFIGTKKLLDYAKANHSKRLVYISSSEVYGMRNMDTPSKVNDYGWIDLLNSRNSYSIGKCAAETLCASYYDEYNVASSIIRPGHIYGPTAQVSDNRVSSAWAYAVSRGENIVMKSEGTQLRSYCYCLDSAIAILTVLLKGQSVMAYNISNPESVITIKDMAELLTRLANTELRFELPTEVEKKGFNPMNNSSLDSTELQELGWHGLFNAEEGFKHTIEILQEISTV